MNHTTQLHLGRRNPLTANIGIIGVGHKTYWAQFEGLREELLQKLTRFESKVATHGLETFNFGIVDDSKRAYTVLPQLRASDLDLLFIDMLTYATSATYAPIARALDIPIVLVALQPSAAMDYARGEIFVQLLNDDICSLPEFAGVSVRMGRRVPEMIIGTLDNDPRVDDEISRWCRIACAVHDLRRARIGLMGHVLESMYDMHTDPALITRTFGCHVVQTEPDEVLSQFQKASDDEVADMARQVLGFFDTPDPVSDPVTRRLTDDDLRIASKAAVALEKFIDDQELSGLAYYYEAEPGSEMRQLVTNFIVGNSLLCAQGFPMCGEFDLKTCIAMLIMDRLGIGGSFAEFHPVDFNENTVLVGHDGPHHINIADGRPVLRSLIKYHGKPGSGASVEFKIKVGPITMLSVTVGLDGKLKFVIAEGESVDAPIPPTGNTNTHGKFGPDIRTFLQRWVAEGPTHHFALGIGHHAKDIKRIADIFGIDSVIVTEGVEPAMP